MMIIIIVALAIPRQQQRGLHAVAMQPTKLISYNDRTSRVCYYLYFGIQGGAK